MTTFAILYTFILACGVLTVTVQGGAGGKSFSKLSC